MLTTSSINVNIYINALTAKRRSPILCTCLGGRFEAIRRRTASGHVQSDCRPGTSTRAELHRGPTVGRSVCLPLHRAARSLAADRQPSSESPLRRRAPGKGAPGNVDLLSDHSWTARGSSQGTRVARRAQERETRPSEAARMTRRLAAGATPERSARRSPARRPARGLGGGAFEDS
jgi:hypothetical protein